MATDIVLAKTRAVAQRAIADGGLRATPAGLARTYVASRLSDDLMQIDAIGVTRGDAVRRADAVAAAFLAFRAEQLIDQTSAAKRALQDRAAALRTELDAANAAIASATVTGAPAAQAVASSNLGELLTKRANAQQQLASILGSIDDRALAAQTVVDSSFVIDPAAVAPPQGRKARILNLAAGGIAGGALGLGVVVLQEVFRDRVRRRQDVMTATGAPVLTSLKPLSGSPRTRRRRFARRLARPGEDIQRAVWHLRAAIADDPAPTPGLVVVSIGSDGPATLTAGALVADLARDGKQVLAVDFSARSDLARLFRVGREGPQTLQIAGATGAAVLISPLIDVRSPSAGSPDHTDPDDRLRQDADVVVALARLDPNVGAWHLSEWATCAVLVVTVGRSQPEALQGASSMVRAAGIDMHSTLLVGADPGDVTVGLPDVPLRRLTDASRLRDNA